MDAAKFKFAYLTLEDANANADWLTNDNDGRYTTIDPIDMPDSVVQRIFELYCNTYQRLNATPLISEPSALLDYTRWILFCGNDEGAASATPTPAQIVAFALYKVKTPGLKAGIKGHNGASNARRAVIEFAIASYNVDGVFGEVSPPLETKIADSVPIVPFEQAEGILKHLGKTDAAKTSGEHYVREIDNLGTVEKLMVGRPRKM